MKYLFILNFFLFFSIIGNAQKLSTEFGEITMADLNYQSKDKKAEAVILFDVGEVSFNQARHGGFKAHFKRTTRIKVLKEEGLDRANVEVLLYNSNQGDREEVEKIEAKVYNMKDGKPTIIQFDKKKVYHEKVNEFYTKCKFTLPQVSIGSVIEYRYTLVTPFFSKLPKWAFQDRIPTVHSEFDLKVIPYYEYRFIAQNIKSFTSQNSKKLKGDLSYNGQKYQEMLYNFVMKDVPAFRDESYITSIQDYLMKIDFQLAKIYLPSTGSSREYVTTWEKYGKDLNKGEYFGKHIAKVKKQSKSIFEDNPDLLVGSDVEKTKKIVEYVKNNYIWNEYYGKKTSKTLKEFLESKSGASGDINLFLIGLLQGAGLKAYPLILSSRHNGKITSDYPFNHYFNYVIAYTDVGTGRILSDATTPLLGFNELPIRCINDKGRLIKEKENQWVSVYNHVSSYDKTEINITFSEDLSTSKTSIMKSLNGMTAFKYKVEYKDSEKKLKNYFKKQGLENIENVRTRSFEKTNKPYFLAVESENTTENLMGKVIIRPFYRFPIATNPFTEESRNYDIDFIFTESNSFLSKVTVPEGYKVLELPKETVVDNPVIKINFTTKQEGNQVIFDYSYFFKRAKYTPKDYLEVKKAFAVLVDQLDVQLVLEPIEN
ncbi:DUF3857 domain-containing protein [Flammeovirga aprica]|uniref:DUF3857 domain-containing protein n=1 Tax=Flammeovirga aprica JL-4 TaxID=694437 RepID=A0A7X9NZD0_9BACT|nr:DUF3857 domain-containing protein [Flammeovirga aprica]NME66638.1 DUF3857 domain-containing protein [Flammeovirga aprica JL-4]